MESSVPSSDIVPALHRALEELYENSPPSIPSPATTPKRASVVLVIRVGTIRYMNGCYIHVLVLSAPPAPLPWSNCPIANLHNPTIPDPTASFVPPRRQQQCCDQPVGVF